MKVGFNVLYALSLIGVSSSFADDVPLTEEQRVVYAQYIDLQMWIYTTAEKRNETVPFGYNSIVYGDRWAIVKSTDQTPFSRDRCLLIHRGTFDELEGQDDLDSQFANTTTVNGVPLNTAFWNSYARYEPEQTSALHKAFADTSCRELDITGHSLGGATCMISLVHLSPTFPVVDVVPSAPARSVYRLLNETVPKAVCSNVTALAKGSVVRFNRAAHNDSPYSTGRHDPIGAFPYTPAEEGTEWAHCAHLHVKILSDDQNGGNFAIARAPADFPADSILEFDDFVLWLQGNTTLWHSSNLYAEGLYATTQGNTSTRLLFSWFVYIYMVYVTR